jgi:polysaccharide biosynthesis/export protein
MKLLKTPLLIAAAAAASLLTGCQFPGPRSFDPKIPPAALSEDRIVLTNTAKLDPSLLKLPEEKFTLGPGDRIEVDVMGEPGSAALLTVGPDGKIYYGMLPGLDVWGLTLEQTQDLIQKELGRYVRGKIEIGIVLRGVESKKVWMLGRVAAPGVYSMSNSITLMEAIFNAGGPLNVLGATGTGGTRDISTIGMNEDLVDYKKSFVLRNGKMLPVDIGRLMKGDMTQNIYLHPDDYVYFAPGYSQEVHVFGAVGSPRTVPYTHGMTLMTAIAYAGGTAWDAYKRQVAIVRGSLQTPEIAIVDFGKIERGEAPNVYVAPGDIVFVPTKPWKKLEQYWDIVTSTFVGSVAINEGANAVLSRAAQPTGIFIPLGAGITVTLPPGAH